MAAKLTQIYYHESQLKALYPFAIPYKNQALTVFFENEVIRTTVPQTKAEKIAVCSWKLKEKMRWYIGRPREITQELLETDYEVMSFTKNTDQHRMLTSADRWHSGFLILLDKILREIGINRPGEVKIPIYQNHFSARTDIYKDYVKTYLSPAMEVMSDHPEISKLCMQDSKYSTLTRESGEHLVTKIGINYYPMHPFVLERLFSIYVHNKKINVVHL